jgi:hypothetical protein
MPYDPHGEEASQGQFLLAHHSYILFTPRDSTVASARTLRFVYTYSKFNAKKITNADNFATHTAAKKGRHEPKP